MDVTKTRDPIELRRQNTEDEAKKLFEWASNQGFLLHVESQEVGPFDFAPVISVKNKPTPEAP